VEQVPLPALKLVRPIKLDPGSFGSKGVYVHLRLYIALSLSSIIGLPPMICDIELDGELVYGGGSGQVNGVTVVSPTFASSIIKQGNTFVIRGLTEGRHVVVATDVSNPDCSLDYAFDIETYVPITFEGQTEFEFDICDSLFEFELDTSQIIGGNPIIDDNDNAIYNLRWTYTPLDPNEPGSSFIGRTSFNAGRGTYKF